MKQFLKKSLSSFIPIKFIVNKCNPILLYHSLGTDSNFVNNIDHVDLITLESQLKNIQKYWKFVSIDEYAEAKNKKGITSLTIDDGYKNIIDEALKLFEKLDIPLTIFINSSTFNGKIFWRDKVRYIIENNLVEKFIDSSKLFKKDHIKTFYSISKNPEFNSMQVEQDINEFILRNKIKIKSSLKLCFDHESYLIKHPLVSYGNHTANHYVLSSLNEEEQYQDINECKNFIDKLKVKTSNVFSVPFGGLDSFNETTLNIIDDMNYKTILKSMNNLDSVTFSNQIDRFMPKMDDINQSIKELYLKKIVKNKIIYFGYFKDVLKNKIKK